MNPVACHHPCFFCGAEMVSVEYSLDSKYHYDGVSENACVNALKENPTCANRIGRFCHRQLEDGEVEPPFCKGQKHPKL